jgi:hypothetical protein
MGSDGDRNQERLCWRGPAAIHWTGVGWDTTPCSLIHRYRCSAGTCCSHLQDRTVYPEDRQLSPKRLGISTRSNGVTPQKTEILQDMNVTVVVTWSSQNLRKIYEQDHFSTTRFKVIQKIRYLN